MMYFQGLAIYIETPQIMFHENDINNFSYVFIVIDNGELSFDTFSNADMVKVDDILNDPYGKVEIPLALIEKNPLSNKIIDITQTYKYSRKKLRDKPVLGTFNKNIFDIGTRTYLYSVYVDGYKHQFEPFTPNAIIDITDKVGKILIITWDDVGGSFVWKNSDYDKTNKRVTLFPYLIGDDFDTNEIIIGQVKYDYDLDEPYIDYFVENIYDIPELYTTLDTGWIDLAYNSGWKARAGEHPLQYRKIGRQVIIVGSAEGTMVSGTEYTCATMPSNIAPKDNVRGSTGSNQMRGYGSFIITPTGNIIVGFNNGGASLTTPAYVAFNCTYFID